MRLNSWVVGLWVALVGIITYFVVDTVRSCSPYEYAHAWNSLITHIRDAQDQQYDVDLPFSMQHAETSSVAGVRELNQLLVANHDAICSEAMKLVSSGYYGYAAADLDDVQDAAFHFQRSWRSYWVHFLGEWSGIAESLPTLKRIAEEMKFVKIFQFHVSILWPPVDDHRAEEKGWRHSVLPKHHGILQSIYRYHYALKIPQGDTGMFLHDSQFQWVERHAAVPA